MNLRKISVLYLLPLIFCISCDAGFLGGFDCEDCGFNCLKGDEENVILSTCTLYDNCAFSFYPNSKIDIKEANGIAAGDKNVFELIVTNNANSDKGAEGTKKLIFEVDSKLSLYEINGKDFSELNAHFMRKCPCGDIEFVPAKSGCISGEEQANGVWFVFGKVVVPVPDGEEEIKFETRFDKGN